LRRNSSITRQPRTIPLAPRTARAIALAIGERTGGPLFLAAGGKRLDRHGECHTRTVISPSVTGSMRELYGFELEPEVRDWLDSLSDSEY
jgi:hypothetical protein